MSVISNIKAYIFYNATLSLLTFSIQNTKEYKKNTNRYNVLRSKPLRRKTAKTLRNINANLRDTPNWPASSKPLTPVSDAINLSSPSFDGISLGHDTGSKPGEAKFLRKPACRF